LGGGPVKRIVLSPDFSFFVLCTALIGHSVYGQSPDTADSPWRLSTPLDPPEWLTLSGHQRTRYETLDGQFRAGLTGSDQIFAFRTDLKAEIKLNEIEFVGEMMDSRQELADDGTPLDNTIVNAVDLLQGYVALNLEDPFGGDGEGRLQIGRQTWDFGSRRLIARNLFRNTINNFTGLHASWKSGSGDSLQAFYFLPVNRLPSDRESLFDNEVEIDEETFDTQFWGVHFQTPNLCPEASVELYFYGLDENDCADFATRDRRLYTTGLRLNRKPAKGQGDYEWESVLQTGDSRSSASATDRNDLDHLAHFHHVHAGYTLDTACSPRLSVCFDYASGDEDPNDDENNRFDTLYGARRFEYGPTGIYGAFARSNILSPGYFMGMKPHEDMDFMFGHRFCWLASDRDAWTTSGLRDPTGNSGSYIGHQIEARLKVEILPDNLTFEIGAAHLFAGEFMDDAPNSNGEGDATYAYVETVFTF